MSKAIPPVQKYMSYDPHFVNSNQSIHEAQDIMKKQNIRHLPVMRENELYGIISDRDIKLALSLIQSNDRILCESACQTHIYAVDPDTTIDIVCSAMADHHYGSAVIKQNGKLVGIFTATDAHRALVEISRQKFHH